MNINNKKQLSDPDIMKKYSALVFERQELSQPHNPYDQEIRECASIENGDMEMFRKSISENYTGKLGTLSKNELRNAKNLSIVLITLSSRAAIRGGLLPEIAFSMSDVFIQKIEEMTEPEATINMTRQFQMEYVKMVAEIHHQNQISENSSPRKSIWIDQCKDYIFKHLLAYSPYSYIEIAAYLGFSSQSHLGKIFKKYTGMTLRQYREKYMQNFDY